jgi:hypothetical protein
MRRALNYKNAKIYVIKNHKNELVYVGSTTQSLSKRFSWHKKKMSCPRDQNCKIYKAMREEGIENFYIELVEEYPCDNIEQLHKREGYWIRQFNSYNNGYNSQIQGRSQKEWKHDNKEKIQSYFQENKNLISEKRREFYKNNRNKILSKVKEYCEKNKDLIKEKKKEYHEKHREQLKGKNKEYREKNKEKLFGKVECECGSIVCNKHLSRHYKSIKHQDYMKQSISS